LVFVVGFGLTLWVEWVERIEQQVIRSYRIRFMPAFAIFFIARFTNKQ
jgi:hypothetical protein